MKNNTKMYARQYPVRSATPVNPKTYRRLTVRQKTLVNRLRKYGFKPVAYKTGNRLSVRNPILGAMRRHKIVRIPLSKKNK